MQTCFFALWLDCRFMSCNCDLPYLCHIHFDRSYHNSSRYYLDQMNFVICKWTAYLPMILCVEPKWTDFGKGESQIDYYSTLTFSNQHWSHIPVEHLFVFQRWLAGVCATTWSRESRRCGSWRQRWNRYAGPVLQRDVFREHVQEVCVEVVARQPIKGRVHHILTQGTAFVLHLLICTLVLSSFSRFLSPVHCAKWQP